MQEQKQLQLRLALSRTQGLRSNRQYPSTTVSSDAKPADSAQVNPSQPPVNKPFGSTGENDEI